MTSETNWIKLMFDAIDAKDAKTFSTFLAPDCTFQFGNIPAVTGIDKIEQFVDGFFESIEALTHNMTDLWEVPDGRICHGEVSYTRKNGSVLTVPFANVLKGDERNITQYLIFADTSQLYNE